MQPIYDWFRDFYERTGINLTFIYDDFDRARMIRGFFLTLELAVVTIIVSILVGVAGAWLQGSKLVWIRRIIAGFISFFRNTPPLVQIYFFYFGLGYLLPRVPDGSGALMPMITNVQWAIISLSLFAGAFNIEIFRSGIEAIPKSTLEAATSFGLSRWQTYRLIVLPMAIRVCLPALGNNLVNLVKTTNLAYAIAVPELLYVSKQIWSDSTNVREMMFFVLFAYLCLVFAAGRRPQRHRAAPRHPRLRPAGRPLTCSASATPSRCRTSPSPHFLHNGERVGVRGGGNANAGASGRPSP